MFRGWIIDICIKLATIPVNKHLENLNWFYEQQSKKATSEKMTLILRHYVKC